METALRAAEAGGAVVKSYFESLATADVRAKRGDASYDLVTNADVESEEAVVRVLREVFPDHDIMAEENHADGSEAELLWVVDPLDGTSNFAHAIPHFAVSIACCHRGQPVCGVVLNPITGDCFTAERGLGALHNGKPCRVDPADRLDQSLVGVGFYYDRSAMMRATLGAIEALFGQQIHGIRRFGTAALDLCMVGRGLLGGFFEYTLSPWDFAAGMLFVEEAGGAVTNCRGQRLALQRSGVLASNGRLHPQLLEIVAKHHP